MTTMTKEPRWYDWFLDLPDRLHARLKKLADERSYRDYCRGYEHAAGMLLKGVESDAVIEEMIDDQRFVYEEDFAMGMQEALDDFRQLASVREWWKLQKGIV